ncbi:MAG: DNA recombination protein RmuC [Chitinophagales bacterium]|nr:DNA recombination protein RmuC [Chitinophagales bacterium]
MEILYLLIGVVVGFALAYFFLKSKSQSELSAAIEKARMLEQNAAELKNELRLLSENNDAKLNEERKRVEALKEELAGIKTENANLLQKLHEQHGQLDELNQRFAKEFENLANRILDEKSQKFTEQNRTNLDVILNPLKERIKEFEQKVEQTYKHESAERITLKTEIKNLLELNKQLSEEANNLATALKGDNKQQGNWGELVLEKILERSGLKEGEEYKTQQTAANDEGRQIKPDVIVFLPDNKHIIIDSKVSLVAYEACVNASDENERTKFLKQHVDSVRNHIKLLSDKNYQTAGGYHSPDFVLLFIPIESSFSLALQGDNDLFNFAWDRKIVIVSPSTLLATLRTIASIWKQERQTRNALEIAEEGGKLYDKFVAFVEDLIKVGNGLKKTQGDYEDAMKKLYEGTGNLVRRAEKMRELGAKTSKQIPQNLIDRASE